MLAESWEAEELLMPNYNLAVGTDVLSEVARDRADALMIFGERIGKDLTLEDQGTIAPYLMDEWHEGPHWINPTIPVWELT